MHYRFEVHCLIENIHSINLENKFVKNNTIYYFCTERFHAYAFASIDAFCFMLKCKMIWKELHFCPLHIIEDESETNSYTWQ